MLRAGTRTKTIQFISMLTNGGNFLSMILNVLKRLREVMIEDRNVVDVRFEQWRVPHRDRGVLLIRKRWKTYHDHKGLCFHVQRKEVCHRGCRGDSIQSVQWREGYKAYLHWDNWVLQIKSKWNKNTKWRDNPFLYKSIRMEIKEHTEGQQKGREGRRRGPRSRIDGRVHHTPTDSIRRYIGNRIV